MSRSDPFAPNPRNTAPVEDTNTVPAGTRAEIMSWVGTDKTRARRALDTELVCDDPRTKLVSELEGVLNP